MANLFAQLPENMQEAISTTAGIVVKDFNAEGPFEASAIQKTILFATTGGVKVEIIPTYKDHGADIDNCPKGSKEMMDVEDIKATISGSAVTVTPDTATGLLGPADKSGSDLITVALRRHLEASDFQNIAFVCPYGKQGGYVAVALTDALSTGGLSMQSESEGKVKFPFAYTAHPSLASPDTVPAKFYIKATAAAAVQEVQVSA